MGSSPAVTNYAEIQQNEVDVLRSIFMEDFKEKEVKAGAWNVGHGVPKGPRISLASSALYKCGSTAVCPVVLPIHSVRETLAWRS